jgi:electron transfer flavoprotein alpha subunit
MGNILVFLEHDKGILSKSILSALSAAGELKEKWKKEKLIGVCIGPSAENAAEEALSYGLDLVLYSIQPVFDKYLAIPYAEAVIQTCKEENCGVLVGAATSVGKDFFPRVAVALDAGQASEVVAVNDDGSLKRLMYAGEILADIEVCSEKRVLSIRPTAFSPAEESGRKGQSKEVQFSVESELSGEIVSYHFSEGDRPDLFSADCVVSGGKGLESEENFKEYIFPLADVLGAAVGASRAAVDSGFAPNNWQIGQTGKMVAPKLYIAVGISGAVQHLAGIKDSSVIVAINKNDEAPIFEIADYGLVADLFQAVPELVEEIKKIKQMN